MKTKIKRCCGLCGKSKKLTQTECCRKWICDDEDSYALFSYARNSCSRNHRRYTLCGYHAANEHAGSWKVCQECLTGFELEMVAYYGTNEYNFEKLENPPTFEPTHCADCGDVISLGNDGYSQQGDKYHCETCSAKVMEKILSRKPRC